MLIRRSGMGAGAEPGWWSSLERSALPVAYASSAGCRDPRPATIPAESVVDPRLLPPKTRLEGGGGAPVQLQVSILPLTFREV